MSTMEGMNVYQKALEFSNTVYELTSKFPQSEQSEIVAKLRRASAAIAQNIVGGTGKQNDDERRQPLQIAKDSTDECIQLLKTSLEQKYLDDATYKVFHEKSTELGEMIGGLIDPKPAPEKDNG